MSTAAGDPARGGWIIDHRVSRRNTISSLKKEWFPSSGKGKSLIGVICRESRK
jgi:hypothetical protein